MTVEQAQAFCEASTAGSYKGAAGRLGYPGHLAVLRKVGRFTDAVGRGQLLLSDQHGNVTLTHAGREVLPAAQRLVQAARDLSTPRSGVRFSAYPSVTTQVLASCGHLLGGHPPLLLSDVSEIARRDGGRGLLGGLVGHIHDLVVAPAGLDAPDVVEQPLYRWTLRALLPSQAPAELRSRATVRPQHLAGYMVAVAPTGHTSRALLDALCAEERCSLRVEIESTSQEVLRDLVGASPHHVAVLPDDAFGAPDEFMGPALTDGRGRRRGGGYALYRRAAVDPPDPHEQSVADIAARILCTFAARPRPAVG